MDPHSPDSETGVYLPSQAGFPQRRERAEPPPAEGKANYVQSRRTAVGWRPGWGLGGSGGAEGFGCCRIPD